MPITIIHCFTSRLHYQKLHYHMLVPDVNVLAVVSPMKAHLQSYPCPLQINYFEILAFFFELLLYYKLSLESSQVYVLHHILIQHILVFSFLLEKSSMDGVYVIFILVEHHLSFFFYFYISQELYLMVHTFIIQILGFQKLFSSSSSS